MQKNIKNNPQRVVVLGASPNPDRYSNMAVKALLEHSHQVIPIHLSAKYIEGLAVKQSLNQIEGFVDTLTLYLSPEHLIPLKGEIIALNPGRVIFNPGSENAGLIKELRENGLNVVEACTLVMLRTGQF